MGVGVCVMLCGDVVCDVVCNVVCDVVCDDVSGGECCGKVELLILCCLVFRFMTEEWTFVFLELLLQLKT